MVEEKLLFETEQVKTKTKFTPLRHMPEIASQTPGCKFRNGMSTNITKVLGQFGVLVGGEMYASQENFMKILPVL